MNFRKFKNILWTMQKSSVFAYGLTIFMFLSLVSKSSKKIAHRSSYDNTKE